MHDFWELYVKYERYSDDKVETRFAKYINLYVILYVLLLYKARQP